MPEQIFEEVRYFGAPNELIDEVYIRLGDNTKVDVNLDNLKFVPIFPEFCTSIDINDWTSNNVIKVSISLITQQLCVCYLIFMNLIL